jgi:class 3 adenylate cyclase/Tfp pilus assembly protein PilF
VLFLDIVGYSKLLMDHQDAVLRALQSVVSTTPEFLHAEASKEMIRLPTGDGMALVFFEDAETAARCAVEVSRALKSHRSIPLRIGLHSGPVYRVEDINANQNVTGEGINIAQRVMDCGDAGHILTSQSVADVLGRLSSWKDHLHDLGEAEVKHGVRVHLYNLYTDDVGNAELPQKLRTAQKTAARLRRKAKRTKLAIGMGMAGAIAAVAILFLYPRHAHALKSTDTIVVADFTNTTGDPVFDGTLRQGLAVQLEQSPFLSLVSEQRIEETLRLMGQSPDSELTPDTARQLCRRTESAAFLVGSIASLGNQYVLGLRAVNCLTGDSLAREQVTAGGKEQVLKALGDAAAKMREKLGESLKTVEKFDTPVEQATTPSLQALQVYSLGRKTMIGKNEPAAAVQFFQDAVRLDPNFAMAYAALGTCYSSLAEKSLGAENIRKAYGLRQRVSERERLYIEAHYYDLAAGNLEKARQAYELWAQTYPRDDVPSNNLSAIYRDLGRYDKSVMQAQENVRLSSASSLSYANLVLAYLTMNRLDEAREAAKEAQTKKLDSPYLHVYLYVLAFRQNDTRGMAQQIAWSVGKAGVEDVMLELEAEVYAYSGKLVSARELSRQAVAVAEGEQEKETAASYEVSAALREALMGNAIEARQRAVAGLALSNGRDEQAGGALALSLAGDALHSQSLVSALAKQFPEDTIVQFNYLPTIRAQLAIVRNNPSDAVQNLQSSRAFELGMSGALYPIYVRATAYLAAHRGSEAANEFQKILDHPGPLLTTLIGALAHLGFGRAHALEAESATDAEARNQNSKARTAYNDFLALWKDADPNIPILRQAKAENARLQ